MNTSFVPQLLRVDAAANIGLAIAVTALRSPTADALALTSDAPVAIVAAGLVANGVWLASLARSPRPMPVQLAAAVDGAFVALMVFVAQSTAVETWARLSSAGLAVVVAAIGVAKLALARQSTVREADRLPTASRGSLGEEPM